MSDVAVYDSGNSPVFENARAIKVSANPSSRIMNHPVESGAIISDFMVELPIELDVSIICDGVDYVTTYQEIKAAYLSKEAHIVVTKADTYAKMVIQAIPHEETPDMYDVLVVGIKMREVILVDTQYQALTATNVADPNDQSTVNSGETSSAPVNSTLADAAMNTAATN